MKPPSPLFNSSAFILECLARGFFQKSPRRFNVSLSVDEFPFCSPETSTNALGKKFEPLRDLLVKGCHALQSILFTSPPLGGAPFSLRVIFGGTVAKFFPTRPKMLVPVSRLMELKRPECCFSSLSFF